MFSIKGLLGYKNVEFKETPRYELPDNKDEGISIIVGSSSQPWDVHEARVLWDFDRGVYQVAFVNVQGYWETHDLGVYSP